MLGLMFGNWMFPVLLNKWSKLLFSDCSLLNRNTFLNKFLNTEIRLCLGEASRETSLVAQMVKLLPTMWDTWVQSLGQEDSVEKEMATHASILSRRIPWIEESGGLQSMGSQKSWT